MAWLIFESLGNTCRSWRSLTLTSAFKLCAGMSEKRWSLLIGEHKAATASTAKKRTTAKRIGSMADTQAFLKFIRVFRQSRGVSGKFARPWVGWLCNRKQAKLADFKKTLTSIPLQYACQSQDWPPYWDVIFPSKYRNSRNAVWQEHSTYEFIFPVSRPGGVLRRAIPLPIHSQ